VIADEPSTDSVLAAGTPESSDLTPSPELESPESPENEPEPTTFEDLGLCEATLLAVKEMGFAAPTEVQRKAVPPALRGEDLLVQSRTGSGKTAAYGIPLCDRIIDAQRREVQALVLVPTRELASQVAAECARIGDKRPVDVAAIYGGAAIGPQIQRLKDGAQLVAGTPGRVLDHLRRGTLKPGTIRALVLDECDEMLSMGFLEEITSIVERLPTERQTFLLSATIPPAIERLTKRYLHEPKRLYLSEDFVGVHEIDHAYYLVSGGRRTEDLLKILAYESPTTALIFCNTRDDTSRVADFLNAKGFAAEAISSDLSQKDRERVLELMHAGKLQYLVGTDVAARGIDIADLSHVINYTFPESVDVYVHRTGRTGRAGRSGAAISLVSPREIGSFYFLRLVHKIFPEERHLPTPQELATRREAERYERLLQRLESRNPSSEFNNLARRIESTVDGQRLIALVLQDYLEETAQTAPPARPRGRRARQPAETRLERSRSDRTSDARGGRSERRDGSQRRRRSEGDDGGRAQRKRADGRSRRSPTGDQAYTTASGDVEFFETIDPSGGGSKPRTQEEPTVVEGMARLYVSVGRRHRIPPEDLTSLFQIEADLAPDQIGQVVQRDRHSYIFVKEEEAEQAIARLSGKTFHDRPLRVERAKPPTRG